MRNFKIGIMTEDQTWKVLASFSTYEKADDALDKYCDRHPNAWVDILDGALTPVD